MVQTFTPEHPLLAAVQVADPARVVPAEMARRELLGLPPYRALAVVEGGGAEEFVRSTGLEWAATAKGAMVRADDWLDLGRSLAAAPRPKGSRLRIEVDPARA